MTNYEFITFSVVTLLLAPFLILVMVGVLWLYGTYVTFVMEALGIWKKEEEPRNQSY